MHLRLQVNTLPWERSTEPLDPELHNKTSGSKEECSGTFIRENHHVSVHIRLKEAMFCDSSGIMTTALHLPTLQYSKTEPGGGYSGEHC